MAIANRSGILMYDRLAQAATITSNVTPVTGFPLSNLQNLRMFSTFRSATLSGVTITFDLLANKSLNGFGMLANLTDAATWRVESSQVSNFAVLQQDSGTIAAFTSLPGLGLSYRPPWGRVVFVGFSTATARYVRFTFTDAANPDGQLQFAIPAIGLVWAPAIAQDFNSKPLADVVQGDPGTEKTLRGHRFTWKQLTFAERAQVAEICRTHKTTGRVMVVPHPNERDKQVDEVFVGRIETQMDFDLFLKTATAEWWAGGISLREVDE